MKIFINIASYRDPLLENTVIDAYDKAKYKDSLIFSIVDQGFLNETIRLDRLPFKKQIRYLRIDPQYARGACWARSLSQSQYDGEDYYFQIDSHTLFDDNWDEILVKQFNNLNCYHPKPIISEYPHIFGIEDLNSKKFTYFKDTGVHGLIPNPMKSFQGSNYFVSTEGTHVNKLNPIHGFLISGNFLFCSGSIIEEVPYDPFLFFFGEEHSMALRLWTSGYNIFHVSDIPLYTIFSRDHRPTIWNDQTSQDQALVKWQEYDNRSQNRLGGIVTGSNIGKYGLGTVRSLDNYRKWSGIDYLNRTINSVNIFELDYRTPVPF